MSSLYNLLFGYNALASTLLATLNLEPEMIPRFRDCYLEGKRIVVFTRTGGGNRDYYENEGRCRACYPEYFQEGAKPEEIPHGPWNDDLRKHPCYDYDRDDDFDSTFALFYFRFPEEFASVLKELSEAEGKPESLEEKTSKVIEALKAKDP